jgi:hypothetical protein
MSEATAEILDDEKIDTSISEEVKQNILADVKQTRALQSLIATMPTPSQVGIDNLAQGLNDVKQRVEDIEDRRKSVTRPLLRRKAQVDGWFVPLRTALEELLETIKTKINEGLKAQEAASVAAQEAAAQAFQEQNYVAAQVALQAAPPPIELKGVNTRTVTKWEITDRNLIPYQYCVPSDTLIDAAVREGLTIPGVRVYQETGVVAGRRKRK